MAAFKGFKHYWHDLYYFLAPKNGIDFAMTCKDITEKIDLGEIPKIRLGSFRFWLHISLCQACKNYLDLSRVLSQALREYSKIPQPSIDVNSINEALLKKYSKVEE